MKFFSKLMAVLFFSSILSNAFAPQTNISTAPARLSQDNDGLAVLQNRTRMQPKKTLNKFVEWLKKHPVPSTIIGLVLASGTLAAGIVGYQNRKEIKAFFITPTPAATPVNNPAAPITVAPAAPATPATNPAAAPAAPGAAARPAGPAVPVLPPAPVVLNAAQIAEAQRQRAEAAQIAADAIVTPANAVAKLAAMQEEATRLNETIALKKAEATVAEETRKQACDKEAKLMAVAIPVLIEAKKLIPSDIKWANLSPEEQKAKILALKILLATNPEIGQMVLKLAKQEKGDVSIIANDSTERTIVPDAGTNNPWLLYALARAAGKTTDLTLPKIATAFGRQITTINKEILRKQIPVTISHP